MDLSVNQPAKDYLRKKFYARYTEKVKEQLEPGKSPDEVSVNVRMNVIKEIGVRWLVSLYDYLSSHPDISKNSLVQAGIAGAISNPDSIS